MECTPRPQKGKIVDIKTGMVMATFIRYPMGHGVHLVNRDGKEEDLPFELEILKRFPDCITQMERMI